MPVMILEGKGRIIKIMLELVENSETLIWFLTLASREFRLFNWLILYYDGRIYSW